MSQLGRCASLWWLSRILPGVSCSCKDIWGMFMLSPFHRLPPPTCWCRANSLTWHVFLIRRAGGQPIRRGPSVHRARAGLHRRSVSQLHGRRLRPGLRAGYPLLCGRPHGAPVALGGGPHYLLLRALQVCAVLRRLCHWWEHLSVPSCAAKILCGFTGCPIANVTGMQQSAMVVMAHCQHDTAFALVLGVAPLCDGQLAPEIWKESPLHEVRPVQ